MFTRKLWSLLAVLMALALVISACSPAATPAPTQAPAPTQPPAQPTAAPQPTEAPQATTAPQPTEAQGKGNEVQRQVGGPRGGCRGAGPENRPGARRCESLP